MLLLGAAIVFLPRIFPDGLPVRGYGLMLLVGITSGVGMAMYRARQGGLDPEIILSLAIWLVVCGVVGAQTVLCHRVLGRKLRRQRPARHAAGNRQHSGRRARDLRRTDRRRGRRSSFSSQKHRLPLLAMADLIAPSMAIGLAFGRIGCFLNGCCYGGKPICRGT